MEKTPKIDITVVVCAYNEEKIIKSCLTNLSNQTYPSDKYEVVVINDNSKDNTEKIVLDHLASSDTSSPKITYAKIEHGGLSVGRNTGISLASGEIITFIDGDAVPTKNFLEEIFKFFKEHQDINCVGGVVNLLEPCNNFAKVYHYSTFVPMMHTPVAIIGTNMSFRKHVFDQIGGFYEQFLRRGDETAVFLKGRGIIKSAVSENIVIYHDQPDNLEGWLRTTKDNGYFSAAILYLNNYLDSKELKNSTYFFYVVKNSLLISIPVALLVAYVLIGNLAALVVGIIYAMYLTKKFFISGVITRKIKWFNKFAPTELRSLKNYLILIYMASVAAVKSDFGFIEGLKKFRDSNWKSDKKIGKIVFKEVN